MNGQYNVLGHYNIITYDTNSKFAYAHHLFSLDIVPDHDIVGIHCFNMGMHTGHFHFESHAFVDLGTDSSGLLCLLPR